MMEHQQIRTNRFHQGIYEVLLPVTDLNRSVDFYTKKLGFKIGYGKRTDESILLLYDKGVDRWMPGLFEVEELRMSSTNG